MSTATLPPGSARVSTPDEPYASTSVLAVANLFIRIGLEEPHTDACDMTHMRLQKLCYRAYGHHLQAFGEPLCEERPEIWPRGPGFLGLYLALQYGGRKPIRGLITTPYGTPTITADSRHAHFLRAVDRHYRLTSTLALSDLSHAQGSAWQRAAALYDYRCPIGAAVPDSLIRTEFAATGLSR